MPKKPKDLLKIKSREYPDNIQEVDQATWDAMKAKGLAANFNVIEEKPAPVATPPEVEKKIEESKDSKK